MRVYREMDAARLAEMAATISAGLIADTSCDLTTEQIVADSVELAVGIENAVLKYCREKNQLIKGEIK